MKKLLLLLLFTPCFYACTTQINSNNTNQVTKLEFKGDLTQIDSLEIIVKDAVCNTTQCKTEKISINPKTGNNIINVLPGKKVITITEIKDGKIIGQNTYDETVFVGKPIVIDLSIIPIVSPTSTPSVIISSSPVSTTPTPIIIPSFGNNATPSSTPSPTSNNSGGSSGSGGGGSSSGSGGGSSGTGGGSGAISPSPVAQVSATINPDNISVK